MIFQRPIELSPKMATSCRRDVSPLTALEVCQILTNSDNDVESDIDSDTGGIPSGEEIELDENVQGQRDEDSEGR